MASSVDIFERCRNAYDTGVGGILPAKGDEKPNVLTRYFGGRNRQNHPFVSGYWQFFIMPPEKIFTSTLSSDVQSWINTSAEGFTPPTRTLNKADLPGQGGVGSSFITGQTLTRTFTVTFREYKNLPILSIFELWTSIIDPYVGVSPLSAADWVPSSYKGSAFAIITKPTQSKDGTPINATDIEELYYFDGVFPESAPHDTMGQDINANDIIQHSVPFSFDGWPLTKTDEKTVQYCLSVINNLIYYDTYIKAYENQIGI